jgi:hypothetical protein
MVLDNGRSHTDRAFYDQWMEGLDAHLERGADPQLMASVLGVKLAEVLARSIVGTPLTKAQADQWLARTCAMLRQSTWSFVREIKAQPL